LRPIHPRPWLLSLTFFLCLFSISYASDLPPSSIQQAWIKQSRSSKQVVRREAIRKLMRCAHSACTQALLRLLKHPSPQTRWWASASLRGRKGVGVRRALKQALRDRDVRVQLNTIEALSLLQPPKLLQWLWPLTRSGNMLLRDAVCRHVASHADNTPRRYVSQCLRKFGTLIGDQTARMLLRPNSRTPQALQKMAKAHQEQRIQTNTRHRSYPSIAYRLRLMKRRFHSYRWTLKRKLRYAKRNKPPKRKAAVRCVTQALNNVQTSKRQFEQEFKRYKDAMDQGHFSNAQKSLSLALLHARRAKGAYRDGVRCRVYFYYKRKYRYGRNIHLEGLPIHAYSRYRNFLRIGVGLTHDTFTNILRDDLRHPYQINPLEREWDFLLNTMLGLSFNIRIGDFLFYLHNHLSAHLRANLAELGGIGERLHIQLSHARRNKKNQHILFFQNELHYSSAPPEEEGFPEQFSGIRLIQQATIGAGYTWLAPRGNIWDLDMELKFHYRNLIEQPFPAKEYETLWSGRIEHHLWIALEKQISSVRLGIGFHADMYHFFEQTEQIPALHLKTVLTLQIGDRQKGLGGSGIHLRGHVGLGRVSAFLPSNVPKEDLRYEQDGVLQPLLAFGVYGRHKRAFSRLPFRWLIRYERKLGASIRPKMAYHSEDQLQLELGVGERAKHRDLRRASHLVFAVGGRLRHVTYPRLATAGPIGPPGMTEFGFYAYGELKLFPRMSGRISEYISWIDNRLNDNTDGFQLRNLFSAELVFSFF